MEKNATKTYGMLQTVFRLSFIKRALAFEWHRRFKEGRDQWGMMWGVGGVKKSIHQSGLAKGLGLGLLCWGFKEVQQEITLEEDSNLQIGSVEFPPGQCTSLQLYPYRRLFDKDENQDSSHPPYSPNLAPCAFWLFHKLSLWNNWGDERGCDESHCHAQTSSLIWGLLRIVGTVPQVHCCRRRLLRRGQDCVYYQ